MERGCRALVAPGIKLEYWRIGEHFPLRLISIVVDYCRREGSAMTEFIGTASNNMPQVSKMRPRGALDLRWASVGLVCAPSAPQNPFLDARGAQLWAHVEPRIEKKACI